MLVKFNTKDSRLYGKDLELFEQKIQKRFHRYFSGDTDDTVFQVKVATKKFRFKVELTVPYLGYQLRTETYDDVSPVAALDKGMDALDRQFEKCKTKVSRNKYQTIAPTQTSAPDEEEFQLVRIKSYEMKPMSVQDAIMNMDMLGHNFYMFLNRETNKLSTVYKRDDDAYGLIEPQ